VCEVSSRSFLVKQLEEGGGSSLGTQSFEKRLGKGITKKSYIIEMDAGFKGGWGGLVEVVEEGSSRRQEGRINGVA